MRTVLPEVMTGYGPSAESERLELWPLCALSLRPMHASPHTVQSNKEGVHQFASCL
jgi:hypothetical protein